MSTPTAGSCRYQPCSHFNNCEFVWTVKITKGCYHQSNVFSFKRHEVHLTFYESTVTFGKEHNFITSVPSFCATEYYCLVLGCPPSFPFDSNITFRVETKNKPLPLPINRVIKPTDKIFWCYTESQVLAAYPDFHKDPILTFIVGDVEDSTKQRRFNDFSSLETLSADLSSLLQDQDSGPDVELLCGEDHSIKVHRIIVSARSKVFSAMLKSDMPEGRTGRIEIKHMEREVFDHFVRFLYAGKLPDLNVDTARGLYEAGDQYEVPSLMWRCRIFLEENLKPENACQMLVLADAHSDQGFKENAMDYIVQKKIPLQDELWLPFHGSCPQLSSEVVYCMLKRQNERKPNDWW